MPTARQNVALGQDAAWNSPPPGRPGVDWTRHCGVARSMACAAAGAAREAMTNAAARTRYLNCIAPSWAVPRTRRRARGPLSPEADGSSGQVLDAASEGLAVVGEELHAGQAEG